MPGDKSISHRAVLISALAQGRSVVTGVNLGADVRATFRAVNLLGADCHAGEEDKAVVEIEGCGWAGLREPDDILDAANSGTTARVVLGVCAAAPFATVVTGDDSLRRRPMLRVVAPLRAMGAAIDGRVGGDRLPLWVRGGALRGISWRSPVASAQVKSAILVAGLRADGETSVSEPARSRDHTERMLATAGVRVRRDGATVTVAGGQLPEALDRAVPGDISAALFLIVAAILTPGSDLTVRRVGLNPTRTAALDVLRRMGADVVRENVAEVAGEPVGDVRARASELRATDITPDEVPAVIDEIPVLAVAASRAEGTSVIGGAEELKVKESDRIDALVSGLRALGASAEARADGLRVSGPAQLDRARVDSRGDHRIALAFATAGAVSGRRIEIARWACVDTSFPGWSRTLAAARGQQR